MNLERSNLYAPRGGAGVTSDIGVEAGGKPASWALLSALDFCRARMARNEDVIALLREGDPRAHGYLRYGLALEMANVLSASHCSPKAILTFDESASCDEAEADEPGFTTPVSLIVWVDSKTHALESLIAGADAELTSAYRALVEPQANGLTSLLNIHVVDDRDVEEGAGHGALIASVFQRPTVVWHRPAA